MGALNASPGVIIFTSAATISGLYAFACQIREDRVAREVVRRVRERHPAAWQRMSWVHRRIANPSVKLRELLSKHGVSDGNLEQQIELVERLERHKIVALGAAFLCIAVLLVGSQVWGWVWD